MKTVDHSKTMRIAFALGGWVTAVTLSAAGTAAADTWRQRADMPLARSGISTSVVDGKIYAIGGEGVPNRVDEYDPARNTWTRKADMPTGRVFLATSAVGGKIYAIGGSGTFYDSVALATVEAYDPLTNTWTRKADMPARRDALSTSVVNGKIYAIGGWSSIGGESLVEEYDPATDTWTRKASMPTGRQWVSTSVVNGKIYAIGGGSKKDSSPNGPIVEAYDPVTDTWTRKADMPASRGSYTSVVDEKIYAFGGVARGTSPPTSTLFQYDPATDTWTVQDEMPVRMDGMGTSTVDGAIYVIGGSSANFPYTPRLSTVWGFVPSAEFDFNGDAIVDAQDVVILIDHWLTGNWRYDLAPAPAGDGIVDVQDLFVLGLHLFEDYRLVAHWMMDETAGDVAYDSAAMNDAAVLGDAVWQPDSGQIGGALQLDGINDYVRAASVRDPAEGAFSAFAWVKGGAPGQVILSQSDGANWLMLDTQGTLKTTLKSSRREEDLTSDAVITDDVWHQVGFTWDGMNRVLYVDGSEVARETQAGLQGSQGDLTIGAGTELDPGTFWSGMIDDVSIYDRAIVP